MVRNKWKYNLPRKHNYSLPIYSSENVPSENLKILLKKNEWKIVFKDVQESIGRW
jgi:hypothetical protein